MKKLLCWLGFHKWIVRDELWERIKPEGKPWGSGLLCAKCIGERIEQLDVYSVWKLIKVI